MSKSHLISVVFKSHNLSDPLKPSIMAMYVIFSEPKSQGKFRFRVNGRLVCPGRRDSMVYPMPHPVSRRADLHRLLYYVCNAERLRRHCATPDPIHTFLEGHWGCEISKPWFLFTEMKYPSLSIDSNYHGSQRQPCWLLVVYFTAVTLEHILN